MLEDNAMKQLAHALMGKYERCQVFELIKELAGALDDDEGGGTIQVTEMRLTHKDGSVTPEFEVSRDTSDYHEYGEYASYEEAMVVAQEVADLTGAHINPATFDAAECSGYKCVRCQEAEEAVEKAVRKAVRKAA